MKDKMFHFVIMVRWLMDDTTWIIHKEFDGTDQDCIDFMLNKNQEHYKIFKGEWLKLDYNQEVNDEAEKIFKKHSQGSVLDEEQNNEDSV